MLIEFRAGQQVSMRRVKKFMILELTICLVVGVAGDRCGVTINSTA